MTVTTRICETGVPEIYGRLSPHDGVFYFYDLDGERRAVAITFAPGGIADAIIAKEWVERKAYRTFLAHYADGQWHVLRKATFNLQNIRTFPTFEAADMFAQYLISSE